MRLRSWPAPRKDAAEPGPPRQRYAQEDACAGTRDRGEFHGPAQTRGPSAQVAQACSRGETGGMLIETPAMILHGEGERLGAPLQDDVRRPAAAVAGAVAERLLGEQQDLTRPFQRQ